MFECKIEISLRAQYVYVATSPTNTNKNFFCE